MKKIDYKADGPGLTMGEFREVVADYMGLAKEEVEGDKPDGTSARRGSIFVPDSFDPSLAWSCFPFGVKPCYNTSFCRDSRSIDLTYVDLT